MAFMAKDWVTFGGWLKFELRRLKRAWKELNLVTLICALVGGATGYSLQYLTGIKKAQDVFPLAGLMLGGAVVGFLFHLIILFVTAPAKMLAEEDARSQQLQDEILALKKREVDRQFIMRRRSAAPFLKPTDEDWVRLYMKGDAPGQISVLHYGHPGLLCGTNLEVKDLPEGELVFFPVENHGQAAPSVSLTLDGAPLRLQREPKISDSHEFYFFTYPYEKAKHGKNQLLSMSFETTDGQHDTHKYVLVHGKRILTRIDPPLPSAED